MRRILVDKARRKQTHRHGGEMVRTQNDVDDIPVASAVDPIEVLLIDETLERLAVKAPRAAQLAKLRYFVGCTLAESAEILGVTPATAEADWTYARAWLRRELLRQEGSS
jgi:RNA polymerase sigma factor (TIGR02999 family)